MFKDTNPRRRRTRRLRSEGLLRISEYILTLVGPSSDIDRVIKRDPTVEVVGSEIVLGDTIR